MTPPQIFLFALLGCASAWAQTNTFPTSGDVGIGTTSPATKLEVNGSGMKLGGSFTQTNLRIEAADESGAPAKTVGLELRGYEGRGKGIYITDKNTSHKWFIGEGYAYQGIGIGYSTTNQMEYSANAKFFVGTSGNVGIGTTSPSAKLQVMGGIGINTGTSGNLGSGSAIAIGDTDTGLKQQGDGILSIYTNNTERIRISNGQGNVGIGTTTPDEKLTVKGRIHAEEVKVDLSVPGPDYVFKEGYDLKSLKEVQNHIHEKGHLPNIPSAEEMEKNGVELGIMNMKLLEKIEELTLYTIAQEKRIKHLEKENETLKSITERITKMEALLKTK